MGDACMICPVCGFHECGTNFCPICKVGVENGQVVRKEKTYQRCRKCGRRGETREYYCSCGEVMEPTTPITTALHKWVGNMLVCEEQGMLRTSVMHPEVARELPYCPYCKSELRERPL